MNTNYDTVSGFESDNFDNLAQDAFIEALQSALAEDVEICNYDLSQREPKGLLLKEKFKILN